MSWFVIFLTMAASSYAINRPVYKIVLNQKGYTQFLQYDVETPPMREFTFCTWIRIYELTGRQNIFTYVTNGNRILRLWLDLEGHKVLKFSINDRITSSTQVDLMKDVWRHICLSYQSDYGTWAIYIDSKLTHCQSAQSLSGFVLPGGGRVIMGYGTADNGLPNGFDGEMFGVNMLLLATIEKNHSIEHDNLHQQKAFQKNKIKDGERHNHYVILGDLQTDEIHNNFEKVTTPSFVHENKSLTRPVSGFGANIGLEVEPTFTTNDFSSEKEILDIVVTEKVRTSTESTKKNFWNFVNTDASDGKFKSNKKVTHEESINVSKDVVISEYETPPPDPSHEQYFPMKKLELEPPEPKSFYSASQDFKGFTKKFVPKKIIELPDFETPPALQKNSKVYGQWTSSKFAGSVLNYLKSINFYNHDKKMPAVKPLTKAYDNYPYPSDFKSIKLRPPVQFQRKNFMDHKIKLHKRSIKPAPQINVQILENDMRNDIIKMHAETRPRNVQVTSRGAIKNIKENRCYRHADYGSSEDDSDNIIKPTPFTINTNNKKKSDQLVDLDIYKKNNFMTILPFLKSLEYFLEDSENRPSEHVQRSSDMYSKSLSNANKWHNVKSYSNDYTPRRINLDGNDGNLNIDHKEAEVNKKHPAVRLKYKHGSNKIVPHNEDPNIVKGRELAMQLSNQSNTNHDTISLIKYNHGFLPSINKSKKGQILSEHFKLDSKSSRDSNKQNAKNNFNKQVKLGNALNERHVIGYNEEQKKKSFIGGYENVPDINRYRSVIDDVNSNVPSSLKPKICKTTQPGSRLLYIQPDESIIASHIESPVRRKNIALEFIHQNYNKCSLEGSKFEKSYLLFIDWSKTPVRLFGGAFPKKTTDLCGFFK